MPRKTRIRQILCGCAAPDGDIGRPCEPFTQLLVCHGDEVCKVRGECGTKNRVTNLSAALAEIIEIVCVQITQDFLNLRIDFGFTKKIAVGLCGNGKPVGDFDSLGC